MSIILYLNLLVTIFFPDNLIKVKITPEITMMIPADFRLMTDDEVASKYFTTKRPLAIYTDTGLTVDLGINQSVTNWSPEDLSIMVSFQKSNIYNFYDQIEMIQEGVKEVNGRKAAYFEFNSIVKPEKESFRAQSSVKKYTYIQYMIVGEHSWVFNFTSPVQLQEKWRSDAAEMMNSITFLKKKK